MSDLGNASDCDVDSLTGVDRGARHGQCHRVQAQPRQREREALIILGLYDGGLVFSLKAYDLDT